MKRHAKFLSRAALRQPFVATVSAVAMATACGGAVSSEVEADNHTTNPPKSPCPKQAPVAGEACHNQMSCSYGSGCNEMRARCEDDFKWSVMSPTSCNPPPPHPQCPATEPVPGEACSPSLQGECYYRDCYGTPSVTAKCGADSTWDVSVMSCNPPPPPRCPADMPMNGEACSLPPLAECQYAGCGDFKSIATCGADSKWSTSIGSCNPPPPLECPVNEPVTGAACILPPQTECYYRDCNGTPSVTATCEADSRWAISVMSCNPPPPPSEP